MSGFHLGWKEREGLVGVRVTKLFFYFVVDNPATKARLLVHGMFLSLAYCLYVDTVERDSFRVERLEVV
jgi:hypothetical protein